MAGRNEHERPTGATEEEVAAIADARERLSNLAKEETRVNKKLAPLLAKVRPMQAHLAQVQQLKRVVEDNIYSIQSGIDRRASEAAARALATARAEADRAARAAEASARGALIEETRALVSSGNEALSSSKQPLAKEVARVIGRVLQSSDFVNQLPNAVDQSVKFAVAQTNNADRIRVTTGHDSVRLLLLKDGTVGLIYNPKPDTEELEVASQIAGKVKMPRGEVVNTRVFGVHFKPEQSFPNTFFASKRDSFQGKPFPPRVIPVGFADSIPLIGKIRDILTNGDIDFPKGLGKATIPHPSRVTLR